MNQKIYDYLNRVGALHFPTFYRLVFRHQMIVKFIISGGSAAFVQLALLYVLTEFFGLWYVFSAVVAFIAAFFVSFTAHKFWTFDDHSTDWIHIQAVAYLGLALFNLLLNSWLVYTLVESVGLWYMAAQVVSSALIALETFTIYRKFLFRRSI